MNVFLTGCDKNTEWQLKWFHEEYSIHNKTPIVFANFGVSKDVLAWAEENFHEVMDMTKEKEKGWFLKPISMKWCGQKYSKTCWIDTDCHVLDTIDEIFDLSKPDKLGMVQDRPWTTRTKEMWHNSGVVLFEGVPKILREWIQEVKQNPSKGDQETLHYYLKTPLNVLIFIQDLPFIYNTLRLDHQDGVAGKNAKVHHWTGAKGNDIIKGIMANG